MIEVIFFKQTKEINSIVSALLIQLFVCQSSLIRAKKNDYLFITTNVLMFIIVFF